MSSSIFGHEVLKRCVVKMLKPPPDVCGISNCALDVLADMLRAYLQYLAERTHDAAELCGRSLASPVDLPLGLVFYDTILDMPKHQSVLDVKLEMMESTVVPDLSLPKDLRPHLMSDTARTPAHLPPFPPHHLYKATAVSAINVCHDCVDVST